MATYSFIRPSYGRIDAFAAAIEAFVDAFLDDGDPISGVTITLRDTTVHGEVTATRNGYLSIAGSDYFIEDILKFEIE